MTLMIRAIDRADRARWEELYRGYAAFYRVPMTDEILDTVWGWLLDPEHVVEGLVAVEDEQVIGLAHVRAMPRPLSGATAGFLDDLFVDPAARGSGAADALLRAIKERGRARGWTVVRWITADDNYRARAVYDRHAQLTRWRTYELSCSG